MSAYIRSKVSNNSATDVSIEAKNSSAKLRQDGSFKLPYSSEVSEASPLGSLRYNDTTNQLEFKNPNGWKRVDQFSDLDVVSEQELADGLASLSNSLAYVAHTGNYADLLNIPDNIATREYVTQAINDLIGSAPQHLDTLNELAQALQQNQDFSQTLFGLLDSKLSLSGGTLAGRLLLFADPILPTEAASKQYVDAVASSIEVLDTDDIPEGVNNLYYKKERAVADAKTAMVGSTGVHYNSNTGAISIGQPVETNSNVRFSSVTAEYFISTSTEVPTITSATAIVLNAATEVVVNSPLTLKSYTSAEISDNVPDQGTIAYDSTIKTLKLFNGDFWTDVPTRSYIDTLIANVIRNIPTDVSQLSDSYGLLGGGGGGGGGTGSNEPGIDLDGGTFEANLEYNNAEVIVAGEELNTIPTLPVFESASHRDSEILNPTVGMMIMCGPPVNGDYNVQIYAGSTWRSCC